MPFILVPAEVSATVLTVEAERDGIVVRATALSRREDEVIVPPDLELGEHRFRVVSAEPYSNDQRRVVLEITPSASPRFMHPARMHGAQANNFSWKPEPWTGHTVWIATAVGDPPIVTFTGAVLRVDGPMRLELPLV